MARLLLFRRTRRNWNSFTPLVGALERSGVFREFRVAFADQGRVLPKGAEVVAFSFGTLGLAHVASDLAALKKIVEPRTLFVAGGPHASADPSGTLKLGFDFVFVGEGERTFPEFVMELARGNLGGSPIRKAAGPGVDLDQALHVNERYRLFPFAEISRGCPHACGFCQVSLLFGRRMRHRSPEVVGRGIELAVRAGFRRFRYLTPDAFAYAGGGAAPEEALRNLLVSGTRAGATEQMLGSFPSEVRPDRVNSALLELVREHCVNRTVVIGAQSGSDRVLDLMNRGHTVEQSRQAILAVAAAGLVPHVDLLFCFPGEQFEERRATLNLAAWCIERAGARIHAHVFLPLPGTPAWPARAERLEPEIAASLYESQAGGRLDGDWERQAMQGREIHRWREEGRILA